MDEPGLGLVVAPAGAGKTTMLAQLHEHWGGTGFWLSIDQDDRHPDRLRRSLLAAFGLDPDSDDLDDLTAVLEGVDRPTVLIDDVHELAGSPAASVIEHFVRTHLHRARVILSCRHLSGLPGGTWLGWATLGLVSSDDLRFRLWEVDAALRRMHDTQLAPAQLHAITRATGGWAVAIHLFGLKAQRASTAERAALVENLIGSGRVRDYLLEQVFAHLEPDDLDFLRQISVLPDLRADRCDRLLGIGSSLDKLRGFEAMGLVQAAGDGSFALHRLLKQHLRVELTNLLGRRGVEAHYLRCAEVLDEFGDHAAARMALILGGQQGRAIGGTERPMDEPLAAVWLSELDEADLIRDPWVLQGYATASLADGSIARAYELLADAVTMMNEEGSVSTTAERQLRLLSDWLDPPPGQAVTWPMRMRRIVDGRERAGSGPTQPTPGMLLADGVAHLLAGLPGPATDFFNRVAERDHSTLRLLAVLGTGIAAAFRGDWETTERSATQVMDTADRTEWPAIARMADVLYGLGKDPSSLDGLIAHCEASDDQFGAATARLLFGLLAEELPGRAKVLSEAATIYEAGPGRLLGFVAQAACIASSDRPTTGFDLTEYEIRRLGPLPLGLWTAAQNPTIDPAELPNAEELGSVYRCLVQDRRAALSAAPDGVSIRCVDGIRIADDGRSVPIGELRPKHQELLHILACHQGDFVHRSNLMNWLWPDADEERARGRLQTSISAIRKVLDREIKPQTPATSSIERAGSRYRLAFAQHAFDLGRAELELKRALDLRDPTQALAALEEAIDLTAGEIAPEAGPAGWAVELRRGFRLRFSASINRLLADLPVDAIVARVDLLIKMTESAEPGDPIWDVAVATAERSGFENLASQLRRHRSEWLSA